MKNNRHDDYGTRKTQHKKLKQKNPKKQKNSGEREDKATEVELQASFEHKIKYREGKYY